MNEQQPPRVMWLLNHVAARKFEVSMLKSIGIKEVFLPKIFPADHNFRSASVDFSEDDNLTIPADELAVLNRTDWYREPGVDAWAIANKYFDVVFFIAHRLEMLSSVTRHFEGAAIWRAYGLDETISYSRILDLTRNSSGWSDIGRMGNRFWFGEAYPHLHIIERSPLKKRAIYLPLGLSDSQNSIVWTGERRQLFFVCPEIGLNPYYRSIYDEFQESFSEFDYLVGGSQPLAVEDKRVLGFVPTEQHQRNMQELRVMFYHSTEPNHIHYHPFEAARVGMPLVFMAGGLLDQLGGVGLPGRCKSIAEAQDKIRRLLDGEQGLIDDIRRTQPLLLEPMRPDNCRREWAANFGKILSELNSTRGPARAVMAPRRKRIAIILPVGYRGGTLRSTKVLAAVLRDGSHSKGDDVDIVFAHADDPASYGESDFEDMPSSVTRRSFRWIRLDPAEARRAMTYAGFGAWQPTSSEYVIPDDGMQQFLDCDLWLIVSDRMSSPLLPVRPYILLVHDYLQRYQTFVTDQPEASFLSIARLAERVLVTTKFTEGDALQYAGLDPRKVCRVPMLTPHFEAVSAPPATAEKRPYFIWTTNAAAHKNHFNAFKALRIYWEDLGGNLECHVTGVNTSDLLSGDRPFRKLLGDVAEKSRNSQIRICLRGELADLPYRYELAGSQFLWHPGKVDNGTFSVVEAACLGIPSLSSDYPAMREIDLQFDLKMAWTRNDDPVRMAQSLKWMESQFQQQKLRLPSSEDLEKRSTEGVARQFWAVVRECL